MVAVEGEFPKTGNDPIYASEVNFMGRSVQHYYSGADINLTNAGSAIQELAFIPPSNLIAAQYISLNLNAQVKAESRDIGAVAVNFLTQHKESGGTYSDVDPGTIQLMKAENATIDDNHAGTYNNILHQLTPLEVASGLYLQIQSEITGAPLIAGDSSFTLKQFNTQLK